MPWRSQFTLVGAAMMSRRVAVAVAVVAVVIGLALISRNPRDGGARGATPAMIFGRLGKHEARLDRRSHLICRKHRLEKPKKTKNKQQQQRDQMRRERRQLRSCPFSNAWYRITTTLDGVRQPVCSTFKRRGHEHRRREGGKERGYV